MCGRVGYYDGISKARYETFVLSLSLSLLPPFSLRRIM